MAESLGVDLPRVMAHVRDNVIPAYQACGAVGLFALTMMRADLDRAAKAMAEGDLAGMIAAYQSLKDYKT